MSHAIARVTSAAEFQLLFEVLLEYERSLAEDLRHGAEPTLTSVREKYQEPNAAFLAPLDGDVAGCVAAIPLDSSTVVLHHLYVKPAYRKHGLARALVEAVIHFARDRGFARVVLDTDRERLPAAYNLYVSLGFTSCDAYATVDYRHPTFLELVL
jgi:GNAT superfamily N-acetyltransferase